MYALSIKTNPKSLKKMTDLFHFFQKCFSIPFIIISSIIITPCQSGFIKGDSCVNQLLAITHEIHKNLDANPSTNTIGVFLDMSKAFDKV